MKFIIKISAEQVASKANNFKHLIVFLKNYRKFLVVQFSQKSKLLSYATFNIEVYYLLVMLHQNFTTVKQ